MGAMKTADALQKLSDVLEDVVDRLERLEGAVRDLRSDVDTRAKETNVPGQTSAPKPTENPSCAQRGCIKGKDHPGLHYDGWGRWN